MRTVFSSRKEAENRLLRISAKERQGIDSLVERILCLEDELRQNGELTRRRQRSHRLQALEWLMDMLRPRAEHLMETHALEHPNPYNAARWAANQFNKEK